MIDKKVRKSNIELLRIVSMLLIISGHLAGHGVQHMTLKDSYQLWNYGSNINKVFACFLTGGGENRCSYFLYD